MNKSGANLLFSSALRDTLSAEIQNKDLFEYCIERIYHYDEIYADVALEEIKAIIRRDYPEFIL